MADTIAHWQPIRFKINHVLASDWSKLKTVMNRVHAKIKSKQNQIFMIFTIFQDILCSVWHRALLHEQ